MGSFGQELRQAREARKITLQEIAATTKISCRSLQALEDEHFDLLPGGIFNKGFVRAYARYVGLDEEKTLAAYMATAKVEGSDTDLQTISNQVAAAGAQDSGLNAATLMGILALIVALAVGALWLREHRKEAREQAAAGASQPASQAVSPAVPPAAQRAVPEGQPSAAAETGNGATAPGAGQNTIQDRGQSAAKAAGAGAAQVVAPKAVAAKAGAGEQAAAAKAAPVEVSITATHPSWISVHSDGKAVETLTMDPDNPATRSRSYKAKEELTLVVGNLGGLTVTYNGQAPRTLGAAGQSAKFTFTPRGIEKH